MNLAIVILNYNSSEDCRKCVGLLKQQEGIEAEIIIVDNCSNEKDRLAAERLCREAGCTFIASTENRGYNAGNNIGLRHAIEKGYTYALIANPDMEFPQTDYLAKMLAAIESDKDIAAVGSDIVGADGHHQNPFKPDGDWHSAFSWVKWFFRSSETDFLDDPQLTHYCSKISGCCLLMKLDFIKSIGYFDENVFLYCEEAILAKQVSNAGKKMLYTADCQAIHRHIPSTKGDPVKRFINWRRSRLYFERKYNYTSFFGWCITALSWNIYTYTFIAINKLRKLIR